MNNKRCGYLFGAFLLVFIGIGVTINTAGVFIEALSRTRGFPVSSATFIFSIGAAAVLTVSVTLGSGVAKSAWTA